MRFEDIWLVLYEHGSCANKEEGTRRFWDTLTPYQQQEVFTTITTKLKEDKFVHYDPIRAIKENLPRKPAQQILSFDEYYTRFGTTEEQDGWRREYRPDEQRTIYKRTWCPPRTKKDFPQSSSGVSRE